MTVTAAAGGLAYTCSGQLTKYFKLLLAAANTPTGSCGVLFLVIIFCFVVHATAHQQSQIDMPYHSSYIKASVYHNSVGAATDWTWCCDSGTNRFVTNDINDFLKGTMVKHNTKVSVGGGTCISPAYGTVLVRSTDSHGRMVQCSNVLLMPQCAKKLMPVSPFDKAKCTLTIGGGRVTLTDPLGCNIFNGTISGGLYYFHCEVVHNPTSHDQSFFGLPVNNSRTPTTTSDFPMRLLECHWSSGHMNFDVLRKFLGLKPGPNPVCTACTIALSKLSAVAKTQPRATRVNERMHMDVGFTKGCVVKFHLMMDDFTSVTHLNILDSKADVFSDWITTKKHLENKFFPCKFAFVKTDSESLYTTPQWMAHYEKEGICHETSPRYRHDLNGLIERAMQTIGGPFRCMMIHGQAPEQPIYIAKALEFSNVIRNHTPTKRNNGWSPREKEAGTKLPVNARLLKAPMFSLCFAHVYEDERNFKHSDRGVPCLYLGFNDINNTFIVQSLHDLNRVYETADITSHPHTYPLRASLPTTLTRLHNYDHLAPHDVTTIPPAIPEPQERTVRIREPSRQALENIAAETLNTSLTLASLDTYVLHNFAPDPTTWPEAEASDHAHEWIAAKLLEQETFNQRNVYELVPRNTAAGKRIFKAKPVYKTKYNLPTPDEPTGSVEKRKYRLTIAAYTKMLIQGIDYAEKYAAMVRWSSVLILIAIANTFDLNIVLFDIKSFFLYGDLLDEVYMEQADGWEVPDKPACDWICKLKKSIYGLPQASHCANIKLKEVFNTTAIHPTGADDCVFVTPSSLDGYGALGAHSDDLLTIGDKTGIDLIRSTLKSTFEITEKPSPTVITGCQIERNRANRTTKLHNAAYITDLLEQHGMSDCHAADTPITPGMAHALMTLSTEPPDPDYRLLYQKLVGSLLWLQQKTRFDISFCVNMLCRFLKVATRAHYELARGNPLRYLKGTLNHGLIFRPGSGPWVLSGASDADFAGDLFGSRTMAGTYLRLGEYGTICARASLERKISTSTGMGETFAMASLVKETIWARHLLHDLRHPMTKPTELLTDNDGVFKQSTKAINDTKAKHYRVSQAFIRSKSTDGTISVGQVDTDANPADMLTKANPSAPFKRHRNVILGPQD